MAASDQPGGAECPTCGRDDFASEQGMKRHHAMAHGESIAYTTLQCEGCGEEFDVKPYREDSARYCSYECRDEDKTKERISKECTVCGDSFEVKPSHSDQQACGWQCRNELISEANSKEPVELECEQCGEVFRVKPSHSDQRFCSLDCKGDWYSDTLSGEDHPSWEGGLVEVDCEWCGDTYEEHPSRTDRTRCCSTECMYQWRSSWMHGEEHPQWEGGKVEIECEVCGDAAAVDKSDKDSRRFCSRECFQTWRSEEFSGEGHPMWVGGEYAYGRGWNEGKKEAVRVRDDHECQGCGMANSEHRDRYDCQLHVHHIQKARHFDDPGERNAMDNLITLCYSCHSVAEQMAPLYPFAD